MSAISQRDRDLQNPNKISENARIIGRYRHERRVTGSRT
jgi:hypothetical protein